MSMYKPTLYFLLVWSKIYSLYKIIKRNVFLRYGFIFLLVVVLAILFVFREPPAKKPGYLDPYLELGVAKDAKKKEIGRKYRKMAAQFDPDKAPKELKNEYQQRVVRIHKAYEILMDDKKRENFDKFGDPEGPSPDQIIEGAESIPESILHPGKKFLTFYAILSIILLSLPITLVLIPALKSPPGWIREGVLHYIRKGEELLVDENPECMKYFDNASHEWKYLLSKFPRYEKSIWAAIIPFRIAARKAQYNVVKGDVGSALEWMRLFKKNVSRDLLRMREVQVMIQTPAQDLADTVHERRGKGSRELLELIWSIASKKK